MPFSREIGIGLCEYLNFIIKYSTRLSTNNGGDITCCFRDGNALIWHSNT